MERSVLVAMWQFLGERYSTFSTGAIGVWIMLQEVRRVALIGFDWWEAPTRHHYGDREAFSAASPRAHQPQLEKRFFDKLHAEGRLEWRNAGSGESRAPQPASALSTVRPSTTPRRYILYYSHNSLPIEMEEYFQRRLLEAADGIPIVSVMKKARSTWSGSFASENLLTDFRPHNWSSILQQMGLGIDLILKGGDAVVALAEHDVLYPPSYFQSVPDHPRMLLKTGSSTL